MIQVTVIGASGFVGSAFVRLLQNDPQVKLTCVTRQNFDALPSVPSDVVIEAACNSKKFLADQDAVVEFEASAGHRLKTLKKFPADLHLHISSVDVYSQLDSPATTHEDTIIEAGQTSNYGYHKFLAEQLVRHYSSRWLILRLAGMVGPGLRKNPVFDILNGLPLRIHPDSRYQFMPTDTVASTAWSLIGKGFSQEVFNVCGEGLISMREIAKLAERDPDLSLVPADAQPRIVEASNEKIRRVMAMPNTTESVRDFISFFAKAGESKKTMNPDQSAIASL